MRSDMARVLCDEPRHGMRTKYRKGSNRELQKQSLENSPIKEQGNLRRNWLTHYYDHKEFGDHIQPLRRYLLSCVGRRWDDVYSEITKVIPRGTVVNNHVYTHLFQFIAINVYIKDGVIYDGDYSSSIHQDIYVHPDTGVICRMPSRHKPQKKKLIKKYIPIDGVANQVYTKDDKGIWWQCWLTPTPKPYEDKVPLRRKSFIYTTRYPSAYDIFLHEEVNGRDYKLKQTYGVSAKYCYRKRQLNKREIKRLPL